MALGSPPPLRAHHGAALALICIAGFALRVVGLDHTPPGLWFDEGLNGLNALAILGGETPFYFARHGLPQEPLPMYAIAAVMRLVGESAWAIRFTSALIGTLTLPVVFGCLREMFRSNRWALLATAALAAMSWHVHFSRVGLRTIWTPLAAAAAVWLALRLWRRPRPATAVALGLTLAVGCHTYLAARLLPFIILAFFLVGATCCRARAGLARGLAVALAVFLLAVAPLAVHLLRHPELLGGRVMDIALVSDAPDTPPFTAVGQGRRGLGGVGENLLANLWGFTAWGDHVAKHGVPRLPIFDPLTGALFLLGAWTALRRCRRPAHALLLLWLGGMLLASVLSFGAPNRLRTLGAAPAAIALAVLGLRRVAALARRRGGKRAAFAVVGLWLAWFAGLETMRHHRAWAPRPDVWEEFSGREALVAEAIMALPAEDRVAVFGGWLEHDAFVFLTHGRGDLIPLPMAPPLPPLAALEGHRLHVFLLTALAPQRAVLGEARAVGPCREETLRTPTGEPFATHLIIGATDVEE